MLYSGIFLILAFIIFYGLTIYAAFIGAPFVWTPRKALEEALAKIDVKPGEKIYDLGAGSGKMLILAEKKYGTLGVGYELSPIVYLIARINLFLRGAKQSRVLCRNFYNQDLSGADIIFCFLSVHAMARLKPKFEKELRPGTRVISYAFSIHGWEPEKIIEGYLGKAFLYEV